MQHQISNSRHSAAVPEHLFAAVTRSSHLYSNWSLRASAGLKALCLLVVTACASIAVAADKRAEVLGLWSGGDSILQVVTDGNTLRMDLLALEDAVYLAGEPNGPVGAPRRDDNNPDEAMRARELKGINLVSEYSFSGSRWEGKIYDPESGNTYNSRMWLEDGILRMRGYVGLPMFGRTASFGPVDHCEPRMQALVSTIEQELEFPIEQCDGEVAR